MFCSELCSEAVQVCNVPGGRKSAEPGKVLSRKSAEPEIYCAELHIGRNTGILYTVYVLRCAGKLYKYAMCQAARKVMSQEKC